MSANSSDLHLKSDCVSKVKLCPRILILSCATDPNPNPNPYPKPNTYLIVKLRGSISQAAAIIFLRSPIVLRLST